jgi:hypothetical protein
VTESLKEFLVRPWVTTIQILQGGVSGGVSGVQPLKVLVNFFVVKACGNLRCAVQRGYYQLLTWASCFRPRAG